VKSNDAIVLTQTSSNKKRRANEIIQNEVCFKSRNRCL